MRNALPYWGICLLAAIFFSMIVSSSAELINVPVRNPDKVYTIGSEFSLPLGMRRMAISQNGRYVAIQLVDGNKGKVFLRLYDVESNREVWTAEVEDELYGLQMTDDGSLIAGITDDDVLYVFKKDDAKPYLKKQLCCMIVPPYISMSRNGKYLVVGNYIKKKGGIEYILVMDLDKREVVNLLRTDSSFIHLSKDGKTLMSYSEHEDYQGMEVRRIPEGEVTRQFLKGWEPSGKWDAIASDDNRRLLLKHGEPIKKSPWYDHKIHMYDSSSGSILWTYDAENSPYMAMSSNGKVIAIGEEDKLLMLKGDDGSWLGTIDFTALDWREGLFRMEIDDEGKLIALVPGKEGSSLFSHLYLLDVASGKLLWRSEESFLCPAVALSGDGSTLALAFKELGGPLYLNIYRNLQVQRPYTKTTQSLITKITKSSREIIQKTSQGVRTEETVKSVEKTAEKEGIEMGSILIFALTAVITAIIIVASYVLITRFRAPPPPP